MRREGFDMLWRRIAITVSNHVLVLLLLGCAAFAAALRQDAVPAFRWDIHIATRQMIIRYGPFHQVCYLSRSRPICDPPEHPARVFSFLEVTREHVQTLVSIPI